MLEIQDWGVSRVGSLEGVRQSLFRAFSPASGGLLAVIGALWLVDASPHLCLHLLMVLFPCVSVQIFPFSMDADHIGLRVHLTPVWPHPNSANHLYRDPIYQIRSQSKVRTLTYESEENSVQAITGPMQLGAASTWFPLKPFTAHHSVGSQQSWGLCRNWPCQRGPQVQAEVQMWLQVSAEAKQGFLKQRSCLIYERIPGQGVNAEGHPHKPDTGSVAEGPSQNPHGGGASGPGQGQASWGRCQPCCCWGELWWGTAWSLPLISQSHLAMAGSSWHIVDSRTIPTEMRECIWSESHCSKTQRSWGSYSLFRNSEAPYLK